jgi:glucose-6-phosphate 1-epimerase
MPIELNEGRCILRHLNVNDWVRKEHITDFGAEQGASVEILLYGATIISWKSPSRHDKEIHERLFLSSKAVLDGTKAVRGGIPVVFPCFGAPTHPDHLGLKQHGFARNENWTYGGVTKDDESIVSVKLSMRIVTARRTVLLMLSSALDPTPTIKKVYNKAFHLSYEVTLVGYELSTILNVRNTSIETDMIRFQALFHNYIRAPSRRLVIAPLQDKLYYDKTEETEEGRNTAKIETRVGVDVRTYTDAVYEDAPQQYKVTWPDGGIAIRSTGLKDVVIWNPQREAGSKLADMEDGGWCALGLLVNFYP